MSSYSIFNAAVHQQCNAHKTLVLDGEIILWNTLT